MKKLSFPTGLLISLAAFLLVLSSVINGAGTSPEILCSGFRKWAPPEVTRLDPEMYDDAAEVTAGYLAGSISEFQLYDSDGAPLFTSREQQHMADCRHLFAISRRVMLTALMVVLALAVASVKGKMWSCAGFRAGLVCGFSAAIVVMMVAAVMCALDFDSMFVLFHKLSFTNDLWLMNPDTDLIVRLMPTEFFISLAKSGAMLVAAVTAALDGISIYLLKRGLKK